MKWFKTDAEQIRGHKIIYSKLIMDNNNDNVNFFIYNAEFRLQYLYESIDGMYLGWKNGFDIYKKTLEEII